MSASVDERIVQMQFDNAQFESKAKVTMSTLDKLKEKLNFTKSTTEVGDIAKKLSDISEASDEAAKNTEKLAKQTTLLGRVVSQWRDDIAKKIKDTAKSLSSALTISPPSDGLNEYKMQMDSIQTILANTKSKGSTMEDVTKALDELNTYADQTIYNFTQMTKNIGTFTAAGVGLKTSVASIKGIANLAAVSGSSAEQASTAMYQLSQAIAAGTVKLQDWNSVVNAGMGGETFQKALERTARVLGTGVDAAMKSANGSFQKSLSKGWLTNDVLTETLAQISGAYDDATLAAKGYTEEQIKEIQDLAETAKNAATQIKTLPQLLDVAKESLGSGWTKSFEYIFGNFEQATKIFTSIGTTMQKFIDVSSDARNSILKEWSDMGGRQQMVTGLANAFWSLYAVVASVKKAFTDIFPAVTGKNLFDLTKKFREFTAQLMISKQTSENIQTVFRALFSLLKSAIGIIGGVAKALSPVARIGLILVSVVLDVLAVVAKLVNQFVDWVNENNLVNKALTLIVTAVGALILAIGKGISTVVSFVKAFAGLPAVQALFTAIGKAISTMYSKVAPYLQLIGKLIQSVVATVRNAKLPNMSTVLGKISAALGIMYSAGTKVAGVFTKVVKSLSGLTSKLGFFDKISKWLVTMASKSKTMAMTSSIVKSTSSSMNELSTSMSSEGISQAPQRVGLISTALTFLSNVASDAKALVVGFFTGIVNTISKIRQAPNVIKLLTDKIKTLKDNAVDFIKNSKFGPFFEDATEALNTFKDNIGEFVNTVSEKLKSLDPKAILAFAFGVGLVALVFKLNTLAEAATGLVKDVSKILSGANATITTFNTSMKTITTAIENTVNSFKKSKIMQVGVAVMAFAASLWVLSSIPPNQLAAEAIAISGIGLAMAVLAKACDGAKATGAAYTIAALGVGILAIAVALNQLGNITWDKSTIAKFGALILAATVLVASTIALSKWAPQMISGATSLLVYSASISLLLTALGRIKDFSIEGMEDSISALIVVIGMLMALSVAAKGVRFSSGLGMIGMVASILVMEKALQKVADSGISWTTIEENLDKFVIVLGAITALSFAAAIAGKYAARAGVGAVLIAAALRLLISPLQELGEMSKRPYRMEKSLEAIAMLGAVFAMMTAVGAIAKYGNKAAVSMVGAAVAITIIVGAMKMLGSMKVHEYEQALEGIIQIMITLGIVMSAILYVSQFTENAKTAPILAMIGMLGAIVAGIAVLTVISDWKSLIAAGASLGLVLTGLGIAFAGIGKVQNGALKSIVTFVEMVGLLAASSAAIFIVSRLPWEQVLAAGASMGVVMLAAAAAAKIAQGASKGAGAMILMSVSIVTAGVALSLMPDCDWTSILAAGASMGVVMLAAAAAAQIARGSIGGVPTMILMSVSMVAAAAAISVIANYDWKSIVAAGGSLSVVMLAAAAAAKIAQGATKGAVAMVVVSAAILVLAAAMRVVGELPVENIKSAAIAISVVAGVITVLGAIAGSFIEIAAGMIAVGAAFALFGVGVAVFGVGAYLLASAVDIFVDAMIKLGEVGPEEAENIKNSIAQIGLGIGEGLANIIVGFASTLLGAIADAIGAVLEWVGEKVEAFTEKGAELLDGLGLGFLTRPDGISTAVSDCVDWIAGLFGNLKTKLKKAGEDALAGLQEGIQSFKDGGFSGLGKWAGGKVLEGFNKITGHQSPWKTMVAAGKDMVTGLEKGVDKGNIGSVGKDSANTFLNTLRTVWGWHSPWDELIQAGKDALAGLAQGFQEGYTKVKGVLTGTAENVKNSLTAPLSNLQKEFSDTFGMGADSSVISAVTNLFPGLTDMLNGTGEAASALGLDADDLAASLGGVADSADSAGSSVGSAGEAASKSSQNIEQNAKFLKYAAQTVKAYTKQYGQLNTTLGDTAGIVSATEAITLLATRVYESEQAYTQTITTAEEAQTRIDDIKKSFVSLYESIQSSIESAIKINEEFDYKFGTTSKSMLSNIDSQIIGFQDYSKALQEMVQRGFDADAVREYAKSNVSSIGEMSALLMMSRTEIEKWNSDYRAVADIKQNGAAELLSTVANALVRANVDVEKSSKDAHDAIKQYIQDGTYTIKDAAGEVQSEFKDTSTYIVDSASDAANAYGDMAKEAYKVYDANGDVVQSFVKIGDASTEQSHVVETAYKAMQQSIEDTLESQRKFFEEFDTGEDDEDAKTADDYLDMMQSQIDGTRKWGEMLENISNTLGDATGAKDFVEYLTSLGPESYKIVSAFNDASEEQLESAVHRYKEIMSLAGTESDQIAGTFRQNGYYSVDEWSTAVIAGAQAAEPQITVTADAAGENFGLGYVNGMASTLQQAKDQASTMGYESLNSLQTALQEHSPSKATEEMGVNLGAGLQNGMSSSTVGCLNAAQLLARTVLVRFQMDLDKQNFVNIGKNIGEGLIEGMSDSSIMSKLISTASDLAKSAYDAAREALDINSPSRKFRSLGKSAVEGFAQGFDRYSKLSTRAAEEVSNDALSAVSDIVAAMNIAADDNFDIQPTITPVVDMSNVSAAGGLLNGYFGQVPMNVSSYLNSSMMSDALAAISQNAAGSSDVVSAIRELRSDVQYLGQAIGQAKVTLDTGVIAGAVTPGVSARINSQVNSRGSVWK